MAQHREYHELAAGGEAQEKDAQSSLGAKIDEEAAINIYLAKAWRTPRDSTSSQLAAQYGITMKAVRDVWNLRTWPWVTMPYWTRGDWDLFLRKHLCAECREKGVRSLAEVCERCAKPRRRGRPAMQAALSRRDAAPPSTLPMHDDDEPPGPLLRRLDFPAVVRSAEPERLRRVPSADSSVRPAAVPSTCWYGSGADCFDAYPQFQFRPAPFAPQSTALNASLGVQSRAGRDVLVKFGKQQWPPRSAPVVDMPSHKHSAHADFDGWLRHADMDYCEQQALGGAGHAAGMPRQPQPQQCYKQEAVPNYEEQARAWSLLPEDNLAGRSCAAITAGPGTGFYQQALGGAGHAAGMPRQPQPQQEAVPDYEEQARAWSLLPEDNLAGCSNAGFYPPLKAALNSFHAGNYGAPPLRSTCAGEESLRFPGDDDWAPGAHTWARNWQTAEHWNLSQASMCSDASTLHEHHQSYPTS